MALVDLKNKSKFGWFTKRFLAYFWRWCEASYVLCLVCDLSLYWGLALLFHIRSTQSACWLMLFTFFWKVNELLLINGCGFHTRESCPVRKRLQRGKPWSPDITFSKKLKLYHGVNKIKFSLIHQTILRFDNLGNPFYLSG